MRHTRTYVVAEVSPAAYAEIRALLKEAGYHHALVLTAEHGVVLDMHGIALAAKTAATDETPSDRKVIS